MNGYTRFFRKLTTIIRSIHMIVDSVSGKQKGLKFKQFKKKHNLIHSFVAYRKKKTNLKGLMI